MIITPTFPLLLLLLIPSSPSISLLSYPSSTPLYLSLFTNPICYFFLIAMMPPEQESSITRTPPTILLSNINRSENGSVHAEPSCSASNNVTPCLGDEKPDQPQLSTPRFSLFRESLHPVTLKVCLATYIHEFWKCSIYKDVRVIDVCAYIYI